ncbi:UDP-N-acetylmuramate dehydrogenase [Thiotrichales bacterium 19S9-12]|nr:UDP-N-acetylmuramate dehydrogenase [Thiotrichales bacterium 19S9-11]MCF6811995.1 UDP-N-acetylmuramate dehydrogenase [Thiotrichales bacterium 19S9-12]
MKLQAGTLYEYVLLSQFTSWKIGGYARYLYIPKNIEDLSNFFKDNTLNLPIVYMGLGSNLLLYDKLINAVVILFRGALKHYQFNEKYNQVTVGCGVSVPTIARKSRKLGYNNLNFLAGIPGTLGGALRMNAGAFGGEIWPEVLQVTLMDIKGNTYTRSNKEMSYAYRSLISYNKNELFVEAVLRLLRIDQPNTSIDQLLSKRKRQQPINMLSCGSVFKNPKNDYAARLIDECRLKETQVGGAYISPKHANFIINKGDASFQDVVDLMRMAYEKVKAKFDIELEPEVKIVGANGEDQSIW